MEHRIIAVTPAGRKLYLEVLKTYILDDPSITEWHLWDNCRNPTDREYINELEALHTKVTVIRLENTDGTNRSINRFYPLCVDPKAFYIKIDDDIVYLPKNFGRSLYDRAIQEHKKFLWWSPLVVNNAICTWLLKYHSTVEISERVSCQASDHTGWADGSFALKLHRKFLSIVASQGTEELRTGNFTISLSRFSINCLAFFGEDARDLGDQFCPAGVDDEEWLSACLPTIAQKPGRIIGDIIISHFSFYTQESHLLKSRILDEYYLVAGLEPVKYKAKSKPLREEMFIAMRALKRAVLGHATA